MFRKILIANRGEIACRVAAHRAAPGHRAPSRCTPTPTPARATCAWPTRRCRIGPAPRARELSARRAHPRGGASDAAPRRSIRATASCRRTPASRRPAPRPASSSSARRPRRSRAMGTKSRRQDADGEGRRAAGARLPRRGPGRRRCWRSEAERDRLPGADQGPRRRRRQGHAPRRERRGLRRRAGSARSARRRPPSATTRVLLERYLERPRHIEVQVFADTHGNCVHLFERDCSVQRRHQKVLEEAPAPGMTPKRRAGDGRGRGGGGARRRLRRRRHGRVHRRRSDGNFYFMEMNTRLQVEHPVTEMITGLDLVEWQLRVAAGEPLPLAQDELRDPRPRHRGAHLRRGPGRATSCPRPGALAHLRCPPSASAHVRVDTGVDAGRRRSRLHYDPMIAKLIVWGEDRRSRAGAPRRGARRGTRSRACATNVAFLAPRRAQQRLCRRRPRYRADRAQPCRAVSAGATPRRTTLLAAAALAELLRRGRRRACARRGARATRTRPGTASTAGA